MMMHGPGWVMGLGCNEWNNEWCLRHGSYVVGLRAIHRVVQLMALYTFS